MSKNFLNVFQDINKVLNKIESIKERVQIKINKGDLGIFKNYEIIILFLETPSDRLSSPHFIVYA